MANKMDWLIKKGGINENKLYDCECRGDYKGTIVIPTGGGKSGLMHENVIHHIKNNVRGDKHIFLFNGPLLKLVSQTVVDLLSVIKEVCKEELKNGEIMFFINSSDDGDSYKEILSDIEVSGYPFMDTEKQKGINAFFESDKAKYAIVASCNLSLYKFCDKVSELKQKGAIISVYLDEAHTLSVKEKISTLDYEEEKLTWVDFTKLCASTFVYAFSATPDGDVTRKINEYGAHNGTADYIIEEHPYEYIKSNRICSPNLFIKRVPDGYTIERNLCAQYFREIVARENAIRHKILITVSSIEELRKLEADLYSDEYKVFATCSDEMGMTEDCKTFTKDVIEFINKVDEYNGDCFVLHVKQLIAGIDIKSLTDCIIFNTQHGDTDNYRKFIQIIGRTLRPLPGERGMDIDLRKKKFGNVLFLIPDHFNRETTISYFIAKYYGIGCLNLIKLHGSHPWEKHTNEEIGFENLFDKFDIDNIENYPTEIKELLIDVIKFIQDELLPKVKFAKRFGATLNIEDELKALSKQYTSREKKFLDKLNITDLLSNDWLMEEVSTIYHKYCD